MRVPYLVAGVAVLAVTVVDLLWTTLWVDGGAGPISSRLMSGIWRILRRAGRERPAVLTLGGPVLVVSTFVVWIGFLWSGWTLVFAAGEPALVDTQGRGPIGWTDRLYFVAYTLFTLGIGDIVPRAGPWQLVTVAATATGMLFITLGVSYVVSVLGAVARERSFASSVTALGEDSASFVETGWNGADFKGFELVLNGLAEDIDYLAFQYKAYPILHFYHTGDYHDSAAVGVVIYDDAVTLLRYAVAEEYRPNAAVLRNAHASTRTYVDTLGDAFKHEAEYPPAPPDLDRLTVAGVPTVSDEEFADALADLAEHRQRLLGIVEADAREWPASDDDHGDTGVP